MPVRPRINIPADVLNQLFGESWNTDFLGGQLVFITVFVIGDDMHHAEIENENIFVPLGIELCGDGEFCGQESPQGVQ